MPKTFLLLLLGLLSLGTFPLVSTQQINPGMVAFAADSPPREALRIVVPGHIKDHWKSVDISVVDLRISVEKTYSIAIGETFQIPDSTISLKIETFLPAFIMNGTVITSASDELLNPAAYVVIRDNGEHAFSGWLFSLYPDAHAFKNPRYNFNLTGFNANP